MKLKNLFSILNKLIHIITPLIILIFAYITILNYDKTNDPGGWGGLGLGGNIIISIGWILFILFIIFIFIATLINLFKKGVIKFIVSIINIIIWLSNLNFFVHSEILIISNIVLIIIYLILLVINKDKLKEIS